MEQCITLRFLIEKTEIWFSIIYVANEAVAIRDLWSHIEGLKLKVGQRPWMMAKDFNVLLKAEECSKFTQF